MTSGKMIGGYSRGASSSNAVGENRLGKSWGISSGWPSRRILEENPREISSGVPLRIILEGCPHTIISGDAIKKNPRETSSADTHEIFLGEYSQRISSGEILGGCPRGPSSKDTLGGSRWGYPWGISSGAVLGGDLRVIFWGHPMVEFLHGVWSPPHLSNTRSGCKYSQMQKIASQYIGTRGLAASPSNAAEKL